MGVRRIRDLAEQLDAHRKRQQTAQSAGPMTAKDVAARFKAATVADLLDTLVSLGQARKQGDKYAV